LRPQRLISFLTGVALVFVLACGGDDDGGDSASGGGSENDVAATANRVVLTYIDVLAGKKKAQDLIDIYAPECRQGVDAQELDALLGVVKLFAPELSDLKIEAVDLGELNVQPTADGYLVAPVNPDAVRVRVDGRFVNADEYLAGFGFEREAAADLAPIESLEFVRRDGKLYVGDCSALQDISG
jgi:hypothetical protein